MFKFVSLLMLIVASCAPARAAELDPFRGITTVEVFANSAMRITPQQSAYYRLQIYRLDGMQRIDTQLNQGLPKSQEAALAYMRQNYAAIKRKYEPQILEAAQGLQLAQRYKIDRLPAIVINQRSVVFGVADVDQAIATYQAYRQQKGN